MTEVTETELPGSSAATELLVQPVLHSRKRAFLFAYLKLGTVQGAAAAVGMSRQTHHNWLATDADYAEAFEETRELAADEFEVEARRRAIDGVRRLRLHQGRPIMVPRKYIEPETTLDPDGLVPLFDVKYSDRLLMFIMRALRPEKYGRCVQTQPAFLNSELRVNGVPPRFRAAAAADPERRRA